MEKDQEEMVQKQEDKKETVMVPNLQKEEWAKVEEETETKMPRPCKRRRVRSRPNSSYFKPAGIRKTQLDEIVLESDEFEAINLIDVNMIPQQKASEKMQISQPTFSRILSSGRKKIADAIVNGKAIKIIKKEKIKRNNKNIKSN